MQAENDLQLPDWNGTAVLYVEFLAQQCYNADK